MALHLIYSVQGLNACLLRRCTNDPILLLGDGVYASRNWPETSIPKAHARMLAADCQARGIDSVFESIETVDYAGFVELTEQYSPIVSWKD